MICQIPQKTYYNNVHYKHELNCLPNNLEYLQLLFAYDEEIKKYSN